MASEWQLSICIVQQGLGAFGVNSLRKPAYI